jgi:hypothetical protein
MAGFAVASGMLIAGRKNVATRVDEGEECDVESVVAGGEH